MVVTRCLDGTSISSSNESANAEKAASLFVVELTVNTCSVGGTPEWDKRLGTKAWQPHGTESPMLIIACDNFIVTDGLHGSLPYVMNVMDIC